MAIRKSDEQVRRRRRQLRARLVGIGAVAAVALGVVGTVGSAALTTSRTFDPPSETAEPTVAREELVLVDGSARFDGELGPGSPSWVFTIDSSPGLVSVRLYVSDLTKVADLTVGGTTTPTRSGAAEGVVRSDGTLVVEVRSGGEQASPFRLLVDGP